MFKILQQIIWILIVGSSSCFFASDSGPSKRARREPQQFDKETVARVRAHYADESTRRNLEVLDRMADHCLEEMAEDARDLSDFKRQSFALLAQQKEQEEILSKLETIGEVSEQLRVDGSKFKNNARELKLQPLYEHRRVLQNNCDDSLRGPVQHEEDLKKLEYLEQAILTKKLELAEKDIK